MTKKLKLSLHLRKEQDLNETDDLCSYAYEDNFGGRHITINHVCFAGFVAEGMKSAAIIIDHYADYVGSKKVAKTFRRFFNWVVKESPWKDAFITKTWETALRSAITLNTKLPHSNMIAGAVVLRSGYEGRLCVVWDELVKRGIDPTVAYFFSNFLAPHKEGFVPCEFPILRAHGIVPVSFSVECLKQFIANGPVLSTRTDRNGWALYRTVAVVPDKRGVGDIFKLFEPHITTIKEGWTLHKVIRAGKAAEIIKEALK